jgi:hypothetical protein
MPPKAPVIPYETVERALRSTRLSGQDIRALLRSESWNALDSRNAQLVFLQGFARTECGIPLDSGHLSDVFNLTRERVRKILSKWRFGCESPHRLSTLTLERELLVCDFICKGSQTGNYAAQTELLNFVEERFHVTLTHGWVRTFLSRHSS